MSQFFASLPIRPRRDYHALLESACVLNAIAAGLLMVLPCLSGRSDLLSTRWEGLLTGLALGQIFTAAAWCVLGPGPAMKRTVCSAAWAALVGFLAGLPSVVEVGDPEALVIPSELAAMAVVPWIFTIGFFQAVLSSLKLWLASPEEQAELPPAGTVQFSIRSLLILTAVVAMLLAGGRYIVPQDNGRSLRTLGQLLLAPVSMPLLAALQIMALLHPRQVVVRWLLVLACLVLVTWFEAWVYLPENPRGSSNPAEFFVPFNAVQHLMLGLNLLLLRSAGFRLVRAPREMA